MQIEKQLENLVVSSPHTPPASIPIQPPPIKEKTKKHRVYKRLDRQGGLKLKAFRQYSERHRGTPSKLMIIRTALDRLRMDSRASNVNGIEAPITKETNHLVNSLMVAMDFVDQMLMDSSSEDSSSEHIIVD